MATVITSIGSKSTTGDPVNGQMTMTGSSGSGTPWTGTLSVSSAPTANVGDMLFFDNVYYGCGGFGGGCSGPADIIYLITAVSSTTLTIKYISGAASVDPITLKANSVGSSNAQPYVLRYYSTIAGWDAELDETALYSSGDTAQGEMYKDSDFEMSSDVTINGGSTVGLDTRTLTAAVGERHDGTADSGVRVLCTSTGGDLEVIEMDGSVGSAGGTGNQIQFLEVDCNEKKIRAGIRLHHYTGAQNCLVHTARWTGSYNETVGIKSYSKNTWVCNCIVYDIYGNNGSSNGWGTRGICINNNDWEACVNNTVYGTKTNSSAGLTFAYGIEVKNGGSYQRVYNNIAMETSSDNGTATDFVTQTSTTYTDANYSSDTSAPGDTNYRSESAADTFVSTSAGSEDFHLKDGSNALRVGKDAGANETVVGRRMPYSPYDWDVDIDGRDRDSEADDWDIGADQCDTCSEGGATGNPALLLFFDT